MSDNNNDPIQDYRTSKFLKLFEKNSLKGESVDKYEYNGKENFLKEYINDSNYDYNENDYNKNYYHKSYKNNKNIVDFSMFISALILITFMFVGAMIVMVITKTSNIEPNSTSTMSAQERSEKLNEERKRIEKLEEKYNQYDFSKLNSISFDEGISVPTIYKYLNTVSETIYENYKYSDKRFGKSLTTIEVIYSENFSEKEKISYRQALERNDYILQKTNNFYEYTMVKDLADKNLFIMINVGEDKVLYGIGTGDSSSFFE